MGGKLDFSIIIAVLVLLQLYVLGMGTEKKSNTEKGSNVDQETIADTSAHVEERISAEQESVSLTVHRNNGEEKVYTKSNVA